DQKRAARRSGGGLPPVSSCSAWLRPAASSSASHSTALLPAFAATAVPLRNRGARRLVGDPEEIHGIGGREHDPLVGVLLAAQAAQLLDGLDQRELLPAERLDEAPAADLAARFGRAIERQELAPAQGERLAREQP